MAERLTDRSITALKAADKPYLIFDTEVVRSSVKVYQTGRKAFVFDWRENGRQRRVTIGKFPAWTTAKRATRPPAASQGRTGEIVAVQRGNGSSTGRAGARRRLTRRPNARIYGQMITATSCRRSAGRSEGDHPQPDRGLARQDRASRAGNGQPGAGRAERLPGLAGARPQDRAQPVQGRAP